MGHDGGPMLCRSSTAGGGGSQGTTQLCNSADVTIPSDPDFPPKPDVISTGYISYGHYVRDYNPPFGSGGPAAAVSNNGVNGTYGNSAGRGGVLSPQQSSVLNVSDPRFSATYGNPYLKQVSFCS